MSILAALERRHRVHNPDDDGSRGWVNGARQCPRQEARGLLFRGFFFAAPRAGRPNAAGKQVTVIMFLFS